MTELPWYKSRTLWYWVLITLSAAATITLFILDWKLAVAIYVSLGADKAARQVKQDQAYLDGLAEILGRET